MKSIVLASDHAGFSLKKHLLEFLKSQNFATSDVGTFSENSVDYPEFAHLLAREIESGNSDFGIAICGSGNGVNMTVNKHQKIRGALCWNTEIARLARFHNNANVILLPARFISPEEAEEMVVTFLLSDFEGGRHLRRIEKIPL